MNKTLTRIALLATALCSTQAALADAFTARLTARDVYWAYTGAANGSGLSLLGGDSNYAVAENYSGNTPGGSFVYVVAWTGAGQEDQAFQGSVSSGAVTAYTGGSLWQAITQPAPFANFNAGSGALSLATIESAISGGSWAATAVSRPAATWGDRHGGGQANWIWADTFQPYPAGGYAIFRTQVGAPVTSVPEPSTQAMMLLALAAGGLAHRAGSKRSRG